MRRYISYSAIGALLLILMSLVVTGCSPKRPPLTQAEKQRLIQAHKHYQQGLALSDKKDYKRAINEFDQAINMNPRFADYWFHRGHAYAACHQNDKAIEDMSRAIEIHPEDEDYWFVRGMVFITRKEYGRAARDMSKAIELCRETHAKSKDVEHCPNYVDAYNMRALAYCLNGDSEKSIADYNQLISMGDKDAYAFLGRGRAYHEMGKKVEARTDYEKAVTLDPSGKNGKEARMLLARLKRGKMPEPLQ